MALTGARLDGAECCWAGLATHFLADEALALAKERIAGGETVATVLDDLATTPARRRLRPMRPTSPGISCTIRWPRSGVRWAAILRRGPRRRWPR
jgi:enoyl-CoA hydratase/carnithine racemase